MTDIARLRDAGRVEREERPLAGRVGSALYCVGGLSLIALATLPGGAPGPSLPLIVIAAATIAWGVGSFLFIDWEHAPGWVFHVSCVSALACIGAAMGFSDGAESPAWIDFYFLVVFAAYFFRAPVAHLYMIGCVAVHAAVLLTDPSAPHQTYALQLAAAGPAYLALGSAIVAGRSRTRVLRQRAERLAAEQGALRRVATAVVGGAPAKSIYDLVGFEAAQLLGGGAAGIMRLVSPEQAVVEGAWADHRGGRYEAGVEVPVRPGSDIELAVRTGRPVRIGQHAPGSPVVRLGYASSVVAPVRVADCTWGVLAVAAAEPNHFSDHDEEQLLEFGDLLATAITSLEDRARLAAQAVSDPLTGLANHRELQKRLAAEIGRAGRHREPLSVAVIDIDHFKSINDLAGHDTGDGTLVEVARCLAQLSRAEDVVGRLGGDEFGWILPATTRQDALIAVERARRMIGATVRVPHRITVSAGICDLEAATHPSELLSCADRALYWSKANGRDRVWVYDATAIGELTVDERAERLARAQALSALRALAHTVDAKDPSTRAHSERVSELAGKLAREAGWPVARAQLLSEAALVHDVGKVAVPDAVLSKLGPLTPDEHEQIKPHASLAARIAEKVLDPEQVKWILTHHERPDGSGYPAGLQEEEIPEGGALLALAEAWDAMTVGRVHRQARHVDEALRECVELVGHQFTAPAVSALARLHASGELTGRPGRERAVA